MSSLHRSFIIIKDLITKIDTNETKSVDLIDKHFTRITEAVHKRRDQLLNELKTGGARQRSMLNEHHERINRDVRTVTGLKTAALNAITAHQCDTFNAKSNQHRTTLARIAKRQVTAPAAKLKKLTYGFNLTVNLPSNELLLSRIGTVGRVCIGGLPSDTDPDH